MSISQRTMRTLVVCVLVSLALTSGVSAIPSQTSTVTEIDSCTTIDESGTYELTADIENSDEERCIVIEASGVEFDGNGHLVDGVGDDNTNGIYAADIRSVIIENVEVSGWDEGIRTDGVTIPSAYDIIAHHNKDGIKMVGANDGVVDDSEVYENTDDGVHLKNGSEASVYDSHIYDNGEDGIYHDNAGEGTIEESIIEGNGDDGIDAQLADELAVRHNNVRENGDDGIFFREALRSNAGVYDNVVRNNGDDGIDIKESTDIGVFDNTVCGNDDQQIVIRDGSDGTFRNNTVTC